jgi:UDP-3-O-[3-hydroxymyristoyl] glucosamine N-acyltransferase
VKNPFFKNYGPFKIDDLLKDLNLKDIKITDKDLIYDIKDLTNANKENLTFFHLKKYYLQAQNTKASYCITFKNLANYLPKTCKPICVENVLLTLSKITSKFYPESINDDFDNSVKKIEDLNLNKTIKFGKNVFLGDNVKIGKNSLIGHNTIIEKNVVIGSNCSIGSNVIIRNTIIENNVIILDGCIIGKKGFGFFPQKQKNIKYPSYWICFYR